MAFERRSSRRMMAQINVVPYIDVMLVLLVIFMVTAPLIPAGQIELPQVGKSAIAPSAPLEVIIRADGALRIRDRAQSGPEQEITRRELVQRLRKLTADDPERPVVIAADRNVRYEEVVQVLDLLQSNQIRRVGLLAAPKQ